MTQDIDLQQAILAALGTQQGIEVAIVFGSLAVGRGQVESDIDLAVDAGRCLTVGEKAALISALAERTGRPVDLVDIRTVGEPFLGQILRYGKRILGSDTRYGDLIRRHLFEQRIIYPIETESSLKGGRHGSGSDRTKA